MPEPIATPDPAELVRCERYRDQFPRGMSLCACLRRQLERQGSVRKGELGPPRRPFCSAECQAGRERRWAAEEAGVALGACPACGAALVGTKACSACEARAQEASKGPARGFLPERPDAVSRVIWGPNAPDAPLGPPPSEQARPPAPNWTLTGPVNPKTVARRSREAAEAEHDQVEVEERAVVESPAHPAPAQAEEDEVMPTGKRATPCPKCGGKGSRHMGFCPDAGGGRKAKPAKGTPPVAAPRAAVRGRNLAAVRPLEGKTVAQLLDLKAAAELELEAVDLELAARREELDAALAGRVVRATTAALAAGAGG